jgi:chaperonin GroEL
VCVKSPGFGERKTSYLEDISVMVGATMVKEELGITLEKADESVLGIAAKVVIGKESCTIVGDGSTAAAVSSRVAQIRSLIANTEQDFEKEKLEERVARLSGGVAIIQVRVPLRGKDTSLPLSLSLSLSFTRTHSHAFPHTATCRSAHKQRLS